MPGTGEAVASACPDPYRPAQRAGPRSVGRTQGTGRPTVLLTGGSGVVGRALLRRLGECDVIDSRQPGPGTVVVCGWRVSGCSCIVAG